MRADGRRCASADPPDLRLLRRRAELRARRQTPRLRPLSKRKHRGALFTVNLGGSRLTRITPWALGAGFPDWSPNGKLIVFSSYSNEGLRPGRSRNLYAVHPDGTGLRPRTQARGGFEQNFQPSCSPDSEWIVFTREPNAQSAPGSTAIRTSTSCARTAPKPAGSPPGRAGVAMRIGGSRLAQPRFA